MKQNQWLLHAAAPTIQARIQSDPVLPLYDCLTAQFGRWTPVTWPDAVVGLHVVYGWMPTIPNLALPGGLLPAQQARVVKLLNDARARLLTSPELTFLKTHFTNNSIVGLSKLLHFMAPARYAIWDKRVATAWYAPIRPAYVRYTMPAAYLAYLKALRGWPRRPRAAAVGLIRGLSPHLTGVTELRILELVLFHV